MGGSSSDYQLPAIPTAVPPPPPPPAVVAPAPVVTQNAAELTTIEDRIKATRKSTAASVTGVNRTQETRGTSRKTSLTGVDTFGSAGTLG